MDFASLLLSVGGYIFAGVNVFSIYSLYKAKSSAGYSKTWIWLISLAVSMYTLGFWLLGEMMAFIAGIVQLFLVIATIKLIYKYAPQKEIEIMEIDPIESSSSEMVVINI